MIMQTKSEREISSMDGVDSDTIDIIRAVMREHGFSWGKPSNKTSHTNGG